MQLYPPYAGQQPGSETGLSVACSMTLIYTSETACGNHEARAKELSDPAESFAYRHPDGSRDYPVEAALEMPTGKQNDSVLRSCDKAEAFP